MDPALLPAGLPFTAAGPAPAAWTIFYSFDEPEEDDRPMSKDFKLLMIGAMYENGGNTTHRFLDGHPQLFVYPFESQPGTRLVNDMLELDIPGQVPLAGVRARRDAGAGLPGDHRRGVQGARPHAECQ